MTAHPEFGKELKRPFEVHENCYDCGEFYDACEGWRASKDFTCRDFNRLPDVGINGKLGQEFPPSRRRAPAEPKPVEQDPPESSRPTVPEPDPASSPAIEVPREDSPAEQSPKQARQQSPAANPGPCGQRLCGCGVLLRKRERCCATCRAERRKQTMCRRRSRERPSTAVDGGSGLPFAGPGTLSTPCGSGAHN